MQFPLYIDDLIIIIKCDRAKGFKIFIILCTKVQEFSSFLGLYTKSDKSNIRLRGKWDLACRVQLLIT